MTPADVVQRTRAARAPHWRWMTGIRVESETEAFRVAAISDAAVMLGYERDEVGDPPRVTTPAKLRLAIYLPDIHDAATQGCMLAMARQAHEDIGLSVRLEKIGRPKKGVCQVQWQVRGLRGLYVESAPSEGEALLEVLHMPARGRLDRAVQYVVARGVDLTG